jgi:hypothetical protein
MKGVMNSLRDPQSLLSQTRQRSHFDLSEPSHQSLGTVQEIKKHDPEREASCKPSTSNGRHRTGNMWYSWLVFAPLLTIFLASRLWGQATEFGALNGTVTDPVGHVIADVTVNATNTATNESKNAKTNSSGQYRIFNLLPAQYTLTFSAPGFKIVTIEPFQLNVGLTLTQDRELPVGDTTQRVEVSAEGQLLETTTVSSSTTIQTEQINDLPLNGRDYRSLIDLTPGADGTRINGQWSDGNRFVIDGANNTTILGATSAYVPNLDLIQEFSIDSHSTKAEEGGFLGATISAATKSGTNRLRGAAWEFGRNNEFVARNPINDPPGNPFPPYHQNQYGVVVGGPVRIPKIYNGINRTFFFFGFQGYKQTQQGYNYSRVPTQDELNGNFVNSLFFIASPGIPHLYDPNATTTGANPTRMPFFPYDVIPPGRINSLVQSYMSYVLPMPNFTPDANHPTDNRLDIYPSISTNYDYSLRIDHRLGSHDSLWGRYSQVLNASTSQLTTPISQVENLDRRNLVVDWVHIFTPQLSWSRITPISISRWKSTTVFLETSIKHL